MTILVTGSTGFLGTAVVERLLARGVQRIRCFVRPSSDMTRLAALASGDNARRVEVIVGNLLSIDDVTRAMSGVEAVCHVAGAMRGAPAAMFLDTVVASRRLLDGIDRHRVKRFVHVSSLSVYGLAEVPRERLVDESTELESHPERRDAYSHAKVRQERLIQEHAAKTGLDLVVLRPGPLYGCTAPAFPARVGIPLAGWLLHFGGRNVVPFSHVTNCAETVALAATSSRLTSGAYNVVDDDLPTSAEYVRRYKTEFGPVRAIRAPFGATMMVARIAERLNLHGNGLIPPILTPYRAATLWGGHRFDNRKLRNAGVHQIVSTGEGLTAAFAQLRACDDEVPVTPSPIRSRDRAYGMP